jgi:hypothetical protein
VLCKSVKINNSNTTINNNNNINNKLKHLTYVIDIITPKRWEGPGFIEGIGQLVKNREWWGIRYQLPPLLLAACKNE